MPPILFVVDRKEAGQTLAAVLKRKFSLSWSQAKRLVEGRHIRVSGQIETDVVRRLKLGKRVSINAGAIEVKEKGPRKQETRDSKTEDAGPKRGDRKQKLVEGREPKAVPPGKINPKAKATPKPAPLSKAAPMATPKPPRQAPAAPKPPRVSAPVTHHSSLITSDAIVYQDDAIVVVNKPAGLTTMRDRDEVAEFGDRGQAFLTKTLGGLLPGLLGIPGRPVYAVHRIDRDTSGLVAFARTPKAAEALTQQFRRHSTDRRYLALTRGTPKAGKIESVFVRDRGDGRRGSAADAADAFEDGKRAVTHVRVVEAFGPFALVECRLETGRTHQIRIHLGEAGTPLCGETLYDRPVNGAPAPDASGAERPLLHAARLGFRHPVGGEPVTWEVPPPADFAAVLGRLRQAQS